MNFLYFILLGAAAGWLAGNIMKGSGFGILGNIVVGIIGGIAGGWVFSLLGISSNGGLIGSLVTAVVGAIVLIYLVGLFARK
ncbi:MAG: GlsB/YeaQ/YmgE family stress response membrane protein [Chitinophagales bacterium]|nr:GlsB/YeaQ/YmgE family stress response membrane protein [Chitinophagaceae bacterium]MBP9883500.1 GlsB/YeaQ/YmgE family stress response membrane protein [Chitinophagales bacterium]